MSEIWAAAIGAAAAVASTSYAIASAPGMPKTPDLAAGSRAGVEAEASTLAERRALEAAAQQGGKATYTVQPHFEKQAFIKVPTGWKGDTNTAIFNDATTAGQGGGMLGIPGIGDMLGIGGEQTYQYIKYNADDWKAGGKYNPNGTYDDKWITGHTVMQKVKIPGGTKTADFTGYGEADVQGAIARKNAQNILDLEKKYGSDFIDEALKEQQLADPQGTEARKQMYDLIKQQEDEHPDRPVADLLDSQVTDQLSAGKGLDRVSSDVLRSAVDKAQASRGQTGGAQPDYSENLTTGFEGEKRLSDAEQKALGWLTSGATPEDVAYRREQQNLGNLSAFVNNRTPESQFAQLSGAQQGPAPYNTGTPLARENQSVGPAAATAATQGGLMNLGAQLNQADPWMAGLSALLKGANAVGSSIPRTGP